MHLAGPGPMEEATSVGRGTVYQNPTYQHEPKVANHISIVRRKKQMSRDHVDLEDLAASRIHLGLDLVLPTGS